jgi:hypothetical protein
MFHVVLLVVVRINVVFQILVLILKGMVFLTHVHLVGLRNHCSVVLTVNHDVLMLIVVTHLVRISLVPRVCNLKAVVVVLHALVVSVALIFAAKFAIAQAITDAEMLAQFQYPIWLARLVVGQLVTILTAVRVLVMQSLVEMEPHEIINNAVVVLSVLQLIVVSRKHNVHSIISAHKVPMMLRNRHHLIAPVQSVSTTSVAALTSIAITAASTSRVLALQAVS